jgi:hypothetical protein
MEHSQMEFILEQLSSIYRTIEESKSNELLHIEKGIYHLSTQTTAKLLDKESLTSTKKEIVVKSYQHSLYHQSLREYLIGLRVINPLRKITPCFLHTLGAMKHKPTYTCIVYDKEQGSTLAVMLQEGLSFTNWLYLFVQLLLSLEVAQRRTGFTHYDLHAGNVVVSESKSNSYSISLDYLSYHVFEPALVPVIIDLGTASTSLDGRFIGAYNYTNSGIFHFIVAGHDMYKLMVSSYCHSHRSDTRREILRLFEFFGSADPYTVSQGQGCAGIKRAQDEFCKEVLFSEVASYTPMMMIKYIYTKFNQNLAPTVTLVPRCTRSSLLPLDGSEDYTQALVSARTLVEMKSGYVTAAYLLRVTDYSTDPDIKKKVAELQVKLDQDREKRIVADLFTLEDVFKIKYPSQEDLDVGRKELLDIPIRYINASVKEQCFDRLEELIEYQDKLQPFLDMYFTILELDLEDVYDKWVRSFCESKLYMFYIENKINNDRAWRWGETLLASIFSTC